MSSEPTITETKKKPTVRGVFTNVEYFKLWIAQFVSNVGSNITLIVLPLFIFQYTGSTYWLGIITLAEFIPVLIFSPIAGMFVDTHNRKKIMIASDLLNMILISSIPALIIFDTQYPQIYILSCVTLIVFLQGTVNRFFMPARMASIPRLVKQDEIGIAVSISQTTYQLIIILGPILGAMIATFYGFNSAFLVDAATFLFSAFIISLIKTDLKPLKQNKDSSDKPSIWLGTKKMLQIPSLRFIVILFSVIIFADATLNSFLVAFVKNDLGMTNIEFGTTITVLGGSGVLTGLIMSNKIAKVKRPVLLIVIGILLSGISFLPIIIVSKAWQLYVIFFFGGSFNLLVNIPINTIFLRDTTDNIRGQVFSALNMAISLFTIFGIFYGVIFAPIIGLRMLYFINAVLFVIASLCGLFYLLFINNLDKVDETKVSLPKNKVSFEPEPSI